MTWINLALALVAIVAAITAVAIDVLARRRHASSTSLRSRIYDYTAR